MTAASRFTGCYARLRPAEGLVLHTRAQRPGIEATIGRAIEEVRDDANLARHPELAVGVGFQALRYGRDAVRLLDAEGDGLRIRPVVADHRNVGAVQRGDHARHGGSIRRAEDLPREIGGRRVRHRIVRVDDVEPFFPRNLDDFVRERQQILRLSEQWIAGRFHTMERQARLIVSEAKRRVAAQNMNPVTARRERFAQLGRDDAAAANRGIADDADVHGIAFMRLARSIGSRTTKPSAQATPASAPNCASRLSMS